MDSSWRPSERSSAARLKVVATQLRKPSTRESRSSSTGVTRAEWRVRYGNCKLKYPAGPSRASLDGIDILVNNVGLFDVKSFEEIPDDDWSRYFDVNLMSGVRLSGALLPKW